MRVADVEDKELARQKRREKRAKRKARERGEDIPEEAVMLGGPGSEDAEDALALLRSLPLADEDGRDSGGEDEEEAPPRKKTKKWFERDSDGEAEPRRGGTKQKAMGVAEEPQTLEDLEALATGLLDD